ncbi:hypothetical protein TIFTF001_026447 [Ficus carica]|uniref:Uncharacterized protein n=1 Tax=Ficus carica TaxID=3494 RepID=A0AA88DLF8_FICCA|nr:hypothetical protein TIFTF001_026447 [Ficus carica]
MGTANRVQGGDEDNVLSLTDQGWGGDGGELPRPTPTRGPALLPSLCSNGD